ncbi:MAG: GNAT family N-acetyltransferase [Acidimicrobiia bacterium]|nr:GNAT family N-acetyltransferase [Acidimicrobiia bacterium]MDH5615293.1 GNAT family N-acetyltransferase [Acidimicrobiia bacterium]
MTALLQVDIKGHTYGVRPLLPSDEDLLVAGFESLSDEARRMRFFVPTPRLSKTQLHYLTDVDQENHVAIGVLDGAAPVAVGRLIRLDGDPGSADVAITVVDSHQRHGIGLYLVQALAVLARPRRVDELHFDVLAENEPMLRLLDRLGARRTEEGALVHLVVESGSAPEPPHADELVRLFDMAGSVQ